MSTYSHVILLYSYNIYSDIMHLYRSSPSCSSHFLAEREAPTPSPLPQQWLPSFPPSTQVTPCITGASQLTKTEPLWRHIIDCHHSFGFWCGISEALQVRRSKLTRLQKHMWAYNSHSTVQHSVQSLLHSSWSSKCFSTKCQVDYHPVELKSVSIATVVVQGVHASFKLSSGTEKCLICGIATAVQTVLHSSWSRQCLSGQCFDSAVADPAS